MRPCTEEGQRAEMQTVGLPQGRAALQILRFGQFGAQQVT